MVNQKCLVLLATYNGASFLTQQIDSILNQENISITLIVSDDMSTDSTLKIINSYEDTRIKLLPNVGRFGSASQNFFRLIRDTDFELFEFIAFADQDDIWRSDKLISSIYAIKETRSDAFSSNVLAFWEDGTKEVVHKSSKQKKFDYMFSSAGPGCTYVVKNELLTGFKKKLTEKRELTKKIDLHDWLLYAFAKSNNYNWYVSDVITMDYRQHSNNEFGANSGFSTFLYRWKRARDGWYRKQIINTAEFCEINNNIIKLIKRNRYVDRIKLLKNIFQCRRYKKEAIFLALTIVLPGYK